MPTQRADNSLEPLIHTLRGQRVMLDADLAKLYGVATKRFNEAIGRNRERFPPDFAFQLTVQEAARLRSQIATSNAEGLDGHKDENNWSQFATSSRGGRRYRPWAFTEHGALMAANILRSPRAVQMSIYVVRAFVKQREQLVANAAILKRLAEIDKTLLEHDDVLRTIWTQLQPLLAPAPEKPRPRMGFPIKHDRIEI